MARIKIDKLIRSKRRTIGLQIGSDASLVIRAPKSASFQVIEKVVIKHEKWIIKKQEYVRLHPRKITATKFKDGEEYLFLGHRYNLRIVEGPNPPLRFDNGFYLSEAYLSVARQAFTDWYILQARDIIAERVGLFVSQYGFKVNRIKVSNARRRWGSCSSNGNLNFSWRLIMAPLEAIDYVVVHELAHLKERNHSKRFWAEVEKMMPGFAKHKQWFKENEPLMPL